MTAVSPGLPVPVEALDRRWPALDPQSRVVWYVVAGLSSVPPAVALLASLGLPESARDGPVFAAPVGFALSVLLARRRAELGMLVLIATAALLLPAAFATRLIGPVVVEGVITIVTFLGVCWVTCALGSRARPIWSIPLAAVWAAVVVVRLPDESVPLLMLSLGWYAVGVVLRSHHRVATQLQAQADELAAEEQRHAAEAVRLERARLARELHDVVAHCMTVIVIQAQAGRQLLQDDSAAAADALEAIAAAAREAEDDIDALVRLMDPDHLRPLTPELLADLVARAAGTGTVVSVELTGDPADLDPMLSTATHRAIQEALTNALRYAPGAPVRIELATAPYALDVVNGPAATGLTLDEVGAGRGIAGVTERLAAAGRSVESGPTPDGGWRLSVR